LPNRRSSLRAKRSNPETLERNWIASSLVLLAMTTVNRRGHLDANIFPLSRLFFLNLKLFPITRQRNGLDNFIFPINFKRFGILIHTKSQQIQNIASINRT